MRKRAVPTTLFLLCADCRLKGARYMSRRTAVRVCGRVVLRGTGCKEVMQYTPRNMESRDPDTALYYSLEPVIRGMGMSLVELSVFHGKKRGENSGSVQIRAVIYKDGVTGHGDCSRVHLGILPRLELAFPGRDIYLEVSSPGIDRLIKDGSEFIHYIGKGVKCYRTDISGWTAGVLCAADGEKIILRTEDGEASLPYEVIAKARLAAEITPVETIR